MSSIVLVGYDGTDVGRDAVRFAVRVAAAIGAEAVAMTAYPVPPHLVAKGASDGADAQLATLGRMEADLIMSGLHEPGLVSRLVRPGDPHKALVAAAEEFDADLLVVGGHPRYGLGRVGPGTVGERLIHGAPCAVAVVPDGAGTRAIKTIGVAFDGGEASYAALAEAARLAHALEARVLVLAVSEPFVGGRMDGGSWEVERAAREALRGLAEHAVASLGPQTQAEGRVLDGIAGATLADACVGEVDLLVTGSRGYGPLRAVLAGSVSRYLVGHAPCPVLIVPRQAPVLSRVPAPAEAS